MFYHWITLSSMIILMLFIHRKLRLTTLHMLQNGLIILIFVWSLMRMVKGGSRVLGKGEPKKERWLCMLWYHPRAIGPWMRRLWRRRGGGGWFGGGCPPCTIRKKKKWNKEDFRRNLMTHGSQIYWIELQSEGPWMPVDATPLASCYA